MRYRFRVYLVPYPDTDKTIGAVNGIPIWAVLTILIVCTTIISWLRLYAREREPKLRQIEVGGIRWGLTPEFFKAYRMIDAPTRVDHYIKGPYCPKCSGSLLERSGDTGSDGRPLYEIQNPCPRCDF
jgi:hypothetical protein